MSDPPYQILWTVTEASPVGRLAWRHAYTAPSTFATRSNGPRVPNIHLLTQDELVQLLSGPLRVAWPSSTSCARLDSADEPIAPPTTSAYEDETSRERTVCSWQRVQLTHALHADLCQQV